MVVGVFAGGTMEMHRLSLRIFLMIVTVLTVRAMDMHRLFLEIFLMIVTVLTVRAMYMWFLMTMFSLVAKSFFFIITAVPVNCNWPNQHIIQFCYFNLCCLILIGCCFFCRCMVMMLAPLAPVCMLMKKLQSNKVDH